MGEFFLNAGKFGAGDGNRTHIASLEGWSFTTKLHPHQRKHAVLSNKLREFL
jgi:hypothetical protein